MENAGFTKLAATLGLKALLDKDMLSTFEDHDYDGSTFTAYRVTDKGMAWLFANQSMLTLKQQSRSRAKDDDEFSESNVGGPTSRCTGPALLLVAAAGEVHWYRQVQR